VLLAPYDFPSREVDMNTTFDTSGHTTTTELPPSSSFLGISVQHLTIDELNITVEEIVKRGKHAVIANHNLHSLYLCNADPTLRRFYDNATFTHADGMGIILLSRLFGYHMSSAHRTTYADWMPLLMAMAARNQWRVFYLGSKPDVIEKGAAILRETYFGLMLQTHHGYFDSYSNSAENQNLIERINAFRPHLMLVGMGMPRQEHWIDRYSTDLDCNVILPAGAAMDYVAGAVPTPPRWAGRLALEWVFRLAAEPRRLSYRYLIEPWLVARMVVRHFVMKV
jgi:N-acetylglucosaminyldiphosphoundecaprenol N-acetyl-beta-D-mannosaminyltransferase